jgi:DNA repair protein RadC
MAYNIVPSLSIKAWAEEDRPREKLLLKGKSALSDAELLAIIISSGNEKETAVDLAKRILSSAGNNLNELGRLDIETLKKFKGIGEAKAISIVAALEIGRRRQASSPEEKPIVLSSRQAYNVLQAELADLPFEAFVILHLNRRKQLIGKQQVSIGGIAGTVVDKRIILKSAIEKLSSSIIIAHNHPSGNLNPSEQDIKITKELKQACALVDIILDDHLIIGNGNYYSFTDEGRL